jgi:diguanylate cyclase (GGDEF)-like protein
VKLVRQRETALETANVQLEEISVRDPLTQLYNRRYLFQRMQEEIASIADGRTLSVLMIDLDGFKRVNDETGHMRGDALLKEIANALVKSCRGSDVAARYGGDEFVILLPGTAGERATQVAERIAQAIREVGLRFDAKRPVTGSVGLAEAMRDEEVASLLRRADQNAYRAKQSGGNRVAA